MEELIYTHIYQLSNYNLSVGCRDRVWPYSEWIVCLKEVFSVVSKERESLWCIVKSWSGPPVKHVVFVVVFRVFILVCTVIGPSFFLWTTFIFWSLFFRLTREQTGVGPCRYWVWEVDKNVHVKTFVTVFTVFVTKTPMFKIPYSFKYLYLRHLLLLVDITINVWFVTWFLTSIQTIRFVCNKEGSALYDSVWGHIWHKT